MYNPDWFSGKVRRYLFKHALVQDTAYGTLLREPRRALHKRIAETLENKFAEIAESQPELLARHYSDADLVEKAAALWSEAGHRSLERSALIEAIEQLTRALEQISSLPPTAKQRRDQINIQVALINPLIHVRGYAAQETKAAAERAHLLIEQADALGERPEDPLLLLSVIYVFWVSTYVAFNGDLMREFALQFLVLAQKQEAEAPLMIADRVMGISLLTTGNIAESRAQFDSAVRIYDPVQHRPLVARFGHDNRVAVLSYRSWALWFLGYPEAALADAERALRYAREIGHAGTLLYALFHTSFPHTFCGIYPTAKAIAEELITFGRRKGRLVLEAQGMNPLGCVLALTGQWADAV